jgi:nitroreductase
MFIDILTKRRSIRKYQQKPVEKEKIDLLVEAALRAPSSRGVNPWRFVVVTDPGIIGPLAKAKPHGAAFLKNAPLAIVVCADTEKSDVWVEDASIATICLHLAATDLGLGSCWIQMRLRNYSDQQTASDYIAEVLGLDKGLAVEAILAVGYPDEEKKPHDRQSLPYEKVSFR